MDESGDLVWSSSCKLRWHCRRWIDSSSMMLLQWESGTCCSGLRVDGKRLQEGGARIAVLMGMIEKHVAGDLVFAFSDMDR